MATYNLYVAVSTLTLTAGDPLVWYSNPKRLVVANKDLHFVPGHMAPAYNREFSLEGTTLTLTSGDPVLWFGLRFSLEGASLTFAPGEAALNYYQRFTLALEGATLSIIGGEAGLIYTERFFPTHLAKLSLSVLVNHERCAKMYLTPK